MYSITEFQKYMKENLDRIERIDKFIVVVEDVNSHFQ